MARASTWTNSDGLSVGFGALTSPSPHLGPIRTTGNTEIMQVVLGYLQSGTGFEERPLPTAAGTAPSRKDVPIPANSVIIRATLQVTEAYTSAGATTLDIGFKNSAGTDIDLDGIDAVIAKTSIDAIGKVVRCDGAMVVGAVSVGTSDAYISTVVTTGPFTAGESILTIEYIRQIPDDDPTDPITGEV